MPSWTERFQRRRDAPESDGAPVADVGGAALPVVRTTVAVAIFTSRGSSIVAVEVDGTNGRVTDLLNTSRTLIIHPEAASTTEELDVEEVLLAIPPPQEASDQRRRLHRIRLPVRVEVGPYQVEGHVHVPPGARPSGYLFRVNPRFIPLTEAVIRRVDGTTVEQSHSVVLMNFRRVDQLLEIVPDGAPESE
jgi:hypothetical protein